MTFEPISQIKPHIINNLNFYYYIKTSNTTIFTTQQTYLQQIKL